MNLDYAERAALNIHNLFDSEIEVLRNNSDFRKRVIFHFRRINGINSDKEKFIQWILYLEDHGNFFKSVINEELIYKANKFEEKASEKIVRLIDKDLINIIGANNSHLFKIDPFEFEQLMMDIMIKIHGCEDIIKTKKTRDGGVDLIGLFKDPFGEDSKIIVGCKRHKENKLVNLDSIRALSTVQLIHKAPLALYATTGRFSKNIDNFIYNILPIGGMKIADSKKILEWIMRKKITK